jgi:hypothetical protein
MAWHVSKNPEVRKRWRLRLAGWHKSGLTQEAYARANGFSGESLRRWRRWFRRNPSELPALVEVQVGQPAAAGLLRKDDRMIVELCDGRLVHLRPGFNPAAVASLVTTLEQL